MLLQMLQTSLDEEQIGPVARDDVASTCLGILVHQIDLTLALEIVADKKATVLWF